MTENIVYSAYIEIKTVSEANTSEHWTVAAKRHKQQKGRIKIQMFIEKPKIPLPCQIKLTRIAPRSLDSHDNLPTSFKYIVDALSEYIFPGLAVGRADDSKLIKWIYEQKKGAPKKYAIEIEVSKSTNL